MKFSTFLLILFSFLFFSLSFAQPTPGGMRGNAPGTKLPAIGRIYGKIVDSKSKSVEYATIVLLSLNKDSLITGALTKSNGDFSLEKIPFGRYRLRVQYLGFKTLFKQVSVTPNTVEQDIGNLAILPDDKELKAAIVSGTKPTVIMGVDRRIYNVEQDITSRGGTAVDVMKNIPGLTVDADGNVSLRNNSPTIFIDGRPTTITLDQVPSDQIDRVEVITNPSAKYDASASGGIVNVVLKKNTKPGYNGMIGANTGTNQFDGFNKNGFNGNLNIKEGRVNFFISYNLNYNNASTNGSTIRTNLNKGQETGKFKQDDVNDATRLFQFGRVGFDYTISNRNTLTLSQNIMHGGFTTLDNQNFSQDSKGTLQYNGTRSNDQKTNFENYTSQLLWKHTYPKQGKEWSADLDLNMGKNSSTANFTTNSFDPNGAGFPSNPQLQNNVTVGQNQMYTFQYDYTNPITDTARIEFGVKSNYKVSKSSLDAEVKNNSTGENVKDTFLSADYRIYDLTNAAYVNYTNMFAGIGYQAGLRFEQTHFTGELPSKNESVQYYYPNGTNNISKALFPSVYLSKKLNTNNEVQLNFSRKINRPGWMQIMPFIMFSDKNNYQIGNPTLAPEFNNLAEANYNHIFGAGSWLTSAYLRYQESPITPFVTRSSSDSNVLITSFKNGKNAFSYGWENTLKLSFLAKKLDLSFNANIFYTIIKVASTDSSDIENKGISWNGKAIASYKLPSHFTFQVNGSYEAPRIIAQGTTKEVYSVDLSLSKDVTKKLSFTFAAIDIFNTRRFGSVYTTDYFIQDLSRRRDTRFFRIGLVYRFGEMDASIFKRKANKRPDSQNQDQIDF